MRRPAASRIASTGSRRDAARGVKRSPVAPRVKRGVVEEPSQTRERMAHRWLAQAQMIGSARHRSRICDGLEDYQQVQVNAGQIREIHGNP